MHNWFNFDDLDTYSRNLNVYPLEIDSAPGRKYKEFEVNGRNGTVKLDLKRYGNVDQSYDVIFAPTLERLGNSDMLESVEEAESKLIAFRNKIASKSGYKRLTDSFHPDEFYQACYSESFIPTISMDRGLAKITINFERKPERFLTSGEIVTSLTANGSITNPTEFPSKPLLRVYGAGSFYIGSQQISISSADEYTDIDCEATICYKGVMPKGGLVSFTNRAYPVLNAGQNNIALGTGITRIEITPRWYRL